MVGAVVNSHHNRPSLHHDSEEPIIYHVGSSSRNPITVASLRGIIRQYFLKNPWINGDGRPVKVGKFRVMSSTSTCRIYMTLRYLIPVKVCFLGRFLTSTAKILILTNSIIYLYIFWWISITHLLNIYIYISLRHHEWLNKRWSWHKQPKILLWLRFNLNLSGTEIGKFSTLPAKLQGSVPAFISEVEGGSEAVGTLQTLCFLRGGVRIEINYWCPSIDHLHTLSCSSDYLHSIVQVRRLKHRRIEKHCREERGGLGHLQLRSQEHRFLGGLLHEHPLPWGSRRNKILRNYSIQVRMLYIEWDIWTWRLP